MNRGLTILAPGLGYTALGILMISTSLFHSAYSIDETDLKYCNWDDIGRCPDTKDERYRTCLTDEVCANGTQYHCARHYTNRSMIVHGCANSKYCLPGEAPYLDNIKGGEPTNELHVTCAECHDKEHFNDMKRNSSTYWECDKKITCDSEHGIECNPVDESSTDVYKKNRECRCNTLENYAHLDYENGVICSSDKFMANLCYDLGNCNSDMERVQNGTCVPKCKRGHRTKYSDECLEYPDTTTRSEVLLSTNSTMENTQSSKSTSTPQTKIATIVTSDRGKAVSSDAAIGIVVGIGGGIFIVLVSCIFICLRKRLPCLQRNHVPNEQDYGMELQERRPPETFGRNDRSWEENESNAQHDEQDAVSGESEQPLLNSNSSTQTVSPDEGQAIPNRSSEEKLSNFGPDEEDATDVESEQPLLCNSNPTSTQIVSTDQGQTIQGYPVVINVHGDYYNLERNKHVNLSRGEDADKKMTKDECHNGRSEQTKIPENWVLEIEKEISKVSDVERELGKDQLNDLAVVVLRKCSIKLIADLSTMKTADYLHHFEIIPPETHRDISEMVSSKGNRKILEIVRSRRYEGYKVLKMIIKIENPQLFEHLQTCETENMKTVKDKADGNRPDLCQLDKDLHEEDRKEPSAAQRDLARLKETVNDLNPVVELTKLSSKSNFEDFLEVVDAIDRLESFQDSKTLVQNINITPDLHSDAYESDPNRYCPKGYQRLKSTGDGNCLFNSVSILLFGNEDFAPFLRLFASIVAAQNLELFLKDALVNSALSETEETERLHNVIMSTARDKEYMDRQHVQFLSVALKRRIVQFYQNEKLAPFITGDPNEDKDTIDPILSERDSDKDLHILWVYSDEDTGKGENHIVPLLPKDEN